MKKSPAPATYLFLPYQIQPAISALHSPTAIVPMRAAGKLINPHAFGMLNLSTEPSVLDLLSDHADIIAAEEVPVEDPHSIDPATAPEFLDAIADLPGDDALRGARLWEHHRAAHAVGRYVPVMEFDADSKEFMARRVEEEADALVAWLRSYSHVPDGHPDAAKEYAAFERAFRARAVAGIGAKILMTMTHGLEVDPSGRARVVAGKAVGIVLGEDGKYSPEWKAQHTQQEVRAGRVAWMLAYARAREFEGLAQEERAELLRVADLDEGEALSDATMRTLEYLFERLQPGWAKLNTEEGRQEVLAQSRAQARSIAALILQDARSRWLTPLQHAFLAEFPQRPDEDLLPPIVAEVWRLHATLIRHGQCVEARQVLGWIESQGRRGLDDKERAILDQLGPEPADDALTPFVLSDLDALHDKVLAAALL